MASCDPPSTRRLKKNAEDLKMMRLRDEIAKLTAELAGLPERDAKRAPVQMKLIELRKDLMASLGSTQRM